MKKVWLIAIMLIWASSFIFIKWGLAELGPFNLAFWRFLIATPLLLFYVYFRKKSELLKFRKKDIIPLMVLGLTGVSFLYAVQFLALKYTTAINASILINSSVLFIAIFSILFLKENLSGRRISGILLGIAGISLVLSNGRISFLTGSTFFGDMLMIFDGFLWAVYTIAGKSLISRYDTEAVTAWAFVGGMLTLLPFLFVEGVQVPVQALSWVSIIFLSVFCSFIAYVVWYKALENEDASRVSVYIYLIPFFTAIFAFFLLQESITAVRVTGGILTIFGIYLAERD
jgi:drug/metabolite transporter (DMT)-like permease